MSYTKQLYKSSISDFKDSFCHVNNMAIPALRSISINVGIKAVDSDNKFLSYLSSQLSAIAGQKAVLTKSRKSIATFKLRENLAIGCKVTLRGEKMYQFLDRLIYIALPRVRDFRGLSPSGFNQSSHYSFGIKDHTVFPEVDLDNVLKTFGMNITIVTSSLVREESLYLLRKLGLPIRKSIN